MYGVIFTSRNKDNKEEIEGFKERTKAFVTDKAVTELENTFLNFVGQGLPGEMSRFYITINARDEEKTKRALLHYLIDNPDYDITKIDSKIASLAMKKENAAEKKWLFDYDGNQGHSGAFLEDVLKCDCGGATLFSTPNGAAIIVEHGFDTRELLEKWGDIVTLKKDGMLCVRWKKNYQF